MNPVSILSCAARLAAGVISILVLLSAATVTPFQANAADKKPVAVKDVKSVNTGGCRITPSAGFVSASRSTPSEVPMLPIKRLRRVSLKRLRRVSIKRLRRLPL